MDTFLGILAGVVIWIAIGAFLEGKAQALHNTTGYADSWGPFWGVLFWPIVAINLFMQEVYDDSYRKIKAQQEEEKELLKRAQKAKAEREAIEKELSL